MLTSKIVYPYIHVFQPPIEGDSITEFEYIAHLSNDSSNMKKLREHKIETRDLDENLLPHKSVIKVRQKLVKAADGSDYTATDVVTLVSNAWSLFPSIQYQIDGHLVENANTAVPTSIQHDNEFGPILRRLRCKFMDQYVVVS